MALFEATIATPTKISLPVAAECWICNLDKEGCRTPKMKPSGKGKRGILIVGEAPGEDEDKRGRQFVGRTGRELRDVLEKFGVRPDIDCRFTNAAICRPPNNKLPMSAIGHCRPNLMKTIEDFEPKVILLLGSKAVRSLCGFFLNEEGKSTMSRWAGWRIPSQEPNTWICPTFHPSYIMREEKKNYYPVLRRMWENHIKRAVRLKDKPWKKPPDYAGVVNIVKDPDKVPVALKMLTFQHDAVSFDFETNCIKPHSKKAKIVSCAVSNGDLAISYPWHGKAIDATVELLKSKIKKVGFNMKFELGWAATKLGIRVRNFEHCGMITSHGLDNRHGINSLRFQSFVLLGVKDYDSHIKPYLQSKDDSGYSLNRIEELPLDDLLLYGGIDALVEYHVWRKQKERFK
jgi:uracil-DNA glycosylase family 4